MCRITKAFVEGLNDGSIDVVEVHDELRGLSFDGAATLTAVVYDIEQRGETVVPVYEEGWRETD